MKKTSSFNLEESTYEEIIEYKNNNKLSSRNAALEMMLTERRTMLKMLTNKKNKIIENTNIENINNADGIFDDSINDNFSSMPD